jgi:hypothetical protein
MIVPPFANRRDASGTVSQPPTHFLTAATWLQPCRTSILRRGFEPGVENAKEGGDFLDIRGYIVLG